MHSLYGYLSRRTTEELVQILHIYSEYEKTELNTDIIRMVTKILEERATGPDLHFLPLSGEEN